MYHQQVGTCSKQKKKLRFFRRRCVRCALFRIIKTPSFRRGRVITDQQISARCMHRVDPVVSCSILWVYILHTGEATLL